MENLKEDFETVYIVSAPFSGQEEEITASFIIDDECSHEESTLNESSSVLTDAASIFLDNVKYDASDKESISAENTMNCQTLSQMTQDEEKQQLEDYSIKEDASFVNNKKRLRSKNSYTANQKALPVLLPDGIEVDDKTCPYCLKSFNKPGNKTQHMRQVHNVSSRTKGFIKCNECDIQFLLVNKLRQHLEQEHGLRMTEELHKFPNIEAFKIWKHNLERKGEFFTQQYGPKKKQLGIKWGYICHRSGKYGPKTKGPQRRRMIRNQGTYKMGIYCTAAISCEERSNEVIVKYWPQHYGHLKDISTEQLSNEDQCTMEENIINGVPLNDILEEVRENVTNEKIIQMALKKRDIKILKAAFESDEYNPGMTDSESVDRWVGLCLQMEDSPVLCYRQEELIDGSEEFLLVIMTEFQKQLLVSSEKEVVCVDCVHRRKGGRFYLTCISITDECDVAFPVAFCISNKIEKSVIKQFLLTVKESTGPLSCTYFMSESESFFFDAWKEVMNDESKWLWSMWYMDYNIHIQLRFFKNQLDKKAEVYKTMRTLIECQSQTVFETMFQNYLGSLMSDPASKKFGEFLLKKYSPNTEYWAYCYRTDMKPTANFQLDVLHRTLRYCCREGRKTRLDKFIFVLLKFLKMKMLDRLGNILDDEKIGMAIEAINICHTAGLDISTERISSLSDKIWLIRSEDEEEDVYVLRDFDSCPQRCMLRCTECDICVHMYSCSCIPSMINANLCQHIHAVVWKFLTPHFSPMPSPTHDEIVESDNNTASPVEKKSLEHIESVLKKTHNIYKKIRKHKWSLNKESLDTIMARLDELDECIDVCSGKKPPPMDEKSQLIPNVEDSIEKDSVSYTNAGDNFLQTILLPNQVNSQSIQNSAPQTLAYRTVQQTNFLGVTSQTLFLPNQPPLVLPPNNSLQPYILVVPNNTSSNAALQK